MISISRPRCGKRKPRTTITTEEDTRPDDRVDRNFTASVPNALWVADLTYVSAGSGFVYVAFVVEVFSRYIVGWRVSCSLQADVVRITANSYSWNESAELTLEDSASRVIGNDRCMTTALTMVDSR